MTHALQDILSRFHGNWLVTPKTNAQGQIIGCTAVLEQEVLPRGQLTHHDHYRCCCRVTVIFIFIVIVIVIVITITVTITVTITTFLLTSVPPAYQQALTVTHTSWLLRTIAWHARP